MAGGLAVALVTSLIFLVGGVLLYRHARRHYGGVVSPLPQAKVNDGRVFGRPRPEGRDPLRYPFTMAYAWLFIVIGAIGTFGSGVAIAVAVTGVEVFAHRHEQGVAQPESSPASAARPVAP